MSAYHRVRDLERPAPTGEQEGRALTGRPSRGGTVVRTLVSAALAFVVGAIGAFAVGGGFSDATAAVESTTTSTTEALAAEARTYFFDPNETVIATSVIVPVSLEVREDTVNLDYDVMSLAPLGENAAARELLADTEFGGGDEELTPIFPLAWTLTTVDGTEIDTAIANVDVSVARFPVDTPITADDIETIEVTRYLVSTPVDVEIHIAEGYRVSPFPGLTLTVGKRTDLDNQTAFEVFATSDVPIQSHWIFLRGGGPSWESASTASQGSGAWAVVWDATDLPAELPVRVLGTAWLEGEGPVAVSIEGVR
ncbi:MAG: hypothetical protein KDB69_07820 [Acidimicrobiia bacterium]|nr:hypothetical protein [Acidimicrobiia bacterium]